MKCPDQRRFSSKDIYEKNGRTRIFFTTRLPLQKKFTPSAKPQIKTNNTINSELQLAKNMSVRLANEEHYRDTDDQLHN